MSEEQAPDQAPMSSPINDVRKLKTNSAASAAELLEWLGRMRGKSPKEVLGEVANSHLVKSFVQAAFLMAFLIFGWTAASWGWENYVKKDEAPPAEAPTEAAAVEAAPTDIANPETAEMPELGVDDKEKVAEKLGVGETREAPTNVNPLDGSADDLLEGLE